MGVQGIALRWRNRPPIPLLGRHWECKASERQMGAELLDDDAESGGCQSLVREPESYVLVHGTEEVEKREKWVGMGWD